MLQPCRSRRTRQTRSGFVTDTQLRPNRVALTDDYSISEIVVGGWQFSAGHRTPRVDPAEAADLVVRLVSAGFTTLDCADIYSGVEELFGDVLRRYRATATSDTLPLQVHTKFVPDLDALRTVDRAYVERIIDRSLRRLGVERLDLVQFYWWDDAIAGSVEAARCLSDLRDAGKIRHLGATNFDTARLREMEAAGVRFVTNQVQYSLLDRRPEGGLIEYCQAANIKLLAYGTVAGGLLSATYLGVNEPPDLAGTRSLTKYRLIVEEIGGWGALQRLLSAAHRVAAKYGASVASVATRFILEQPSVAGCVVGMTRPAHLHGALATCALRLSSDDHAELRQACTGVASPPGNVYQLERDRSGPHGRIMRYDLNRENG